MNGYAAVTVTSGCIWTVSPPKGRLMCVFSVMLCSSDYHYVLELVQHSFIHSLYIYIYIYIYIQ